MTIPSGKIVEFSFWSRINYATDYPKGRSTVMLSKTGTNFSDFTDTLWTPPLDGNGFPTSSWVNVTVDLSAYDGETIYIAFKYDGNTTAIAHDWFIDDVTVTASDPPEIPDYALQILPVFPTVPYSRIPVAQLTSVTAKAKNVGDSARTNVILSATLNNFPQGTTAPVATLAPGATTGDLTVPLTVPVGANTLRAMVTADGIEDDATLNSIDYLFTGTRNVYALDNIAAFTSSTSAATTTMWGVVYHLTDAATLSQALVALATSTSATTYTVGVYSLTNATTVNATPVAERTGIAKAANNAAGWQIVNFAAPPTLAPGSYYIGVRQTSTYNAANRATNLVFDGNAAKTTCAKPSNGTALTAVAGNRGAAAVRMVFAADSCAHVTNIQVSPDMSYANVSWDGFSAYYQVQLFRDGIALAGSTVTFENFLSVPLSAAGVYHVEITGISDATYSCMNASSTFTRATCADPIVALPWTENFEGQSALPDCWLKPGGANNTWNTLLALSLGTAFAHTPPNAIFHTWGVNKNSWLIPRPIQIPATGVYELSFWSQLRDIPTYYGKSSVRVSTSGTATTDFTDEVWTPVAPVNAVYREEKVNLAAYAGQTIYLAFVYEGDDKHRWAVDDISIYKLPDTPEAPTLFVAAQTATDTVRLTWTNPALTESGSPLTDLNIVIERNGVVIYAYNATAEIGQPATWTDTSPVSPATYTIYGANTEGNGLSATSSICGTVFTFPWHEGFEGTGTGTALPPCWTAQYPGAPTSTLWRRVPVTQEPPFVHSGTGAAFHMYGNGNFNDWLVSPAIVLPAAGSYELSFWTYNRIDPTYGKNSLWLSTTGNDAAADFTTKLWEPSAQPPNNEWEEVKISLTGYAGQVIYLGFRYEGSYAHAVSIDDIRIEQLFDVDASVEAIIKAETGAMLSATEPVIIVIKNKGLTPILAAAGLQVTVELDGVVVATEPLTVDIAPSATYQYTFGATVDLSTPGQTYTLSAYLSLPGDSYAPNDTLGTVVINTGDTATMGTGSPVTGCGIKFYDDGGTGNYIPCIMPVYRETQTMTFLPATPGERVQVVFTDLVLPLSGYYYYPGGYGAGMTAAGDTLYIYNGPVADPAHLIAALEGFMSSYMPLTFRSESADGSLTFVFAKNRGIAAAGWEADITCFLPPARDLRITRVTAPPIGSLADNETVTVTVKNMAGQPASYIPVSLTANCINYQLIYPGPLGVLEEATVTFTGVNLSAPGVHTVTASIDTTGDAVPTDNVRSTTTKTIANTQVLLFNEPFSASMTNIFTTRRFDRESLYGGGSVADIWPYSIFDRQGEQWWVIQMPDSNYVAISNAFVGQVDEGIVDRWLVTPAVELTVNARLSWRAGSTDGLWRESYEVRMSTGSDYLGPDGNIDNSTALSNFNTLLFSIAEEDTEWTTHEVDLSAYAGQTVYFAFRHTSEEKDLLWLDDIQVYGIVRDTLCSGDTYRYAPAVAPGGSMSWTRAAIPGINGGAPASGTGPVEEIIINTTAQPVEVTYNIYTTIDTCSSSGQLIVTVQPQLSLTTATAHTLCSHATFVYDPVSSVSGAGLSWERLPATGITDSNNQTGTSGTGFIAETLINTLNVPVTVIYRYTIAYENCSVAQDVTVTVNPRPTKPNVWIVNGNATFCAGDSITLIAEALNASSYTWLIDGTNTGVTTGQYTTSAALAAGAHTITVSVGSADACTSEATTITVTVNALPDVPTFTHTGDLIFCDGTPGNVLFTAVSSGAASYAWYRNGEWVEGVSGTTYFTSESGTYSVRALDAIGCASPLSAPALVVSLPLPTTPVISLSGMLEFCEGESALLQTNSLRAATYTWYRNGGVLAGQTASLIEVTESGSYSVEVVSSDNCPAPPLRSVPVVITVNAKPAQPSITFSPAGNVICEGDSRTLQIPTVPNATYNWYKDGLQVLNNSTSASFLITEAGFYQAEVVSDKGCISPISTPVELIVNSIPATPVITGDAIACADEPIVLTAESAGASTYVWKKNNTEVQRGISRTYEVNTDVTVNTVDTYTVYGISASGCSSTVSAGKVVEIEVYPDEPLIKGDPLVRKTRGSSHTFEVLTPDGGLQYQWFHAPKQTPEHRAGTPVELSDGQNPTLIRTNIQLSDAGEYYVIAITPKAGCFTKSKPVELLVENDIFVGNIVTPNGDNENDRWLIQGLSTYKSHELRIVNRNGNEVYRTSNYPTTEDEQKRTGWDGQNLPDGVYFYSISLTDKDDTVIKRTGYVTLKH
jgi:gliding motility-associated-like protein